MRQRDTTEKKKKKKRGGGGETETGHKQELTSLKDCRRLLPDTDNVMSI